MAKHERKSAPGKPGNPPRWTSGAKEGVGTSSPSAGGCSLVWFTFARGALEEIYYPRPDTPCTRSLGLFVTHGRGFCSDEQCDAHHQSECVEPGVPAYHLSNVCREGRYQIEKTIFAHPRHHAVVQRTTFRPLGEDLRDYGLVAVLEPHLGGCGARNSAWLGDYKGTAMLLARRARFALALACSAGWKRRSVGFVGRSDGRRQLERNGRLGRLYAEAFGGNVALTGEIDLAACDGEFVLAIGFGAEPNEAAYHARTALLDDLDAAQETYIQGWRAFQRSVRPLPSLSDPGESLYRTSAAVILVHEGKTTGGMVAGLAVPWGMEIADEERLEAGYHLAWPRDLVETAGGLLAAGSRDDLVRRLLFLQVAQETDGHWPQNMWLDGSPFWTCLQLCETALPVLLVDLLRRQDGPDFDAERFWPMVRSAVGFIVRRGPTTEEDRWERRPGYTPYSLATTVAALCCAADLALDVGEDRIAAYLRETADDWNACIEGWLYVTDTELARRVGVEGYYARVLTGQTVSPAYPEQAAVRLRGEPETLNGFAATEMVSPDALALVRFGLRRAYDRRIDDTVKVIDALLRVETSRGTAWRRFNGDDYGETPDGKPFRTGEEGGVGRPWPLLTGERAHFELAAGRVEEARRLMRVMRAFAGEAGMLPEQIWDTDDIAERRLFNGAATGSARPLVWAHAEFVKLCRSLADGRVFDMPVASEKRYVLGAPREARAWWRHDHRVESVPAGRRLRVEFDRPGTVRWTADDWTTRREIAAQDSGLGTYYADVPTDGLAVGSQIRGRCRYENADGDSDEFVVTVADAVRPRSSASSGPQQEPRRKSRQAAPR